MAPFFVRHCDTGIPTQHPMATHPTVCQFQSRMYTASVAVQAGASLLGRLLLPLVRQHLAISSQLTFHLSWCREHLAVMVKELLQRLDLACGTLPAQLCNPDIIHGRQLKGHFYRKHEHGAL